MKKKKKYSIDLCCGAGGLILGSKLAGFVTLRAIEIDQSAIETLRHNKGLLGVNSSSIIQKDINQLEINDLTQPISLVTAGPPCQPFSQGGRSLGAEDPRNAIPAVVNTINRLSPDAFLIENVKGVTRNVFKDYIDYTIKCLKHSTLHAYGNHKPTTQQKTNKYNVYGPLIFNAADYGSPQSRERAFIIGFKKEISDNWEPPTPTHSKEELLKQQFITGEYWSRNKIKPSFASNLPQHIIKQSLRLSSNNTLHAKNKPWTTLRETLKNHDKFLKNHTAIYGARSYRGHSPSHMDWVSKTIKAGVNGTPGGENMYINEKHEIQYYTVRECAEIQGFPDNYEFIKSRSKNIKMIGNAVPIPLAEALLKSIYEELEK